MLDMAASVARVKMVQGLHKGSRLLVRDCDSTREISWDEGFEKSLCGFAAGGGHLAVLKWARARGYPWDEWTCAKAAGSGHLEVLQWARAHGCPWHEQTCAWAASNGHLEVLQWSVANGCMGDGEDWPYILDNAAKNGHLKVLQWARARGCPWDEPTCAYAAKNGHLEVLQWARANGCLLYTSPSPRDVSTSRMPSSA